MTMKKLLPVALLMFLGVTITAQEIKIEIEKGYEFVSIDTISGQGFVFLTKTDNGNGKANEYVYSLYDEDMNYVKEERFNVLKYTYEAYEIDTGDYKHRIFSTMSRKLIFRTESKKEFEFIDVEVQMPKKSAAGDMQMEGDFAWFNMRVGKVQGVYKVNWRTGESDYFPISIDGAKNALISDIQLIPSVGVFVYARAEVKKGFNHYAVLLSNEGEQIGSYLIAHERLLTVKAMVMADNSFLFVGTYTLKSKYESEGLIIAITNNGTVSSEKTLNYPEIPGFTELSGKGNKKGYSVGNLEVVKTESGYMVVGEVCYPVNHRDHNNKLIFDYYQFTHGFVCVLDNEGQISWMGTFEDKFPHYSFDISNPMVIVSEVDAETYNLKSIKSPNNHQVDLTDNSVTSVPYEYVENDSRNGVTYKYSKEKVKTDDGKRVIVTVTKVDE